MRYGFVTCVHLGRACIEDILTSGHDLDLLVTLNDDRAVHKSGRVYLDDVAADYGIPLHKTAHINEPDTVSKLIEANLDWLFIVGWSQIANSHVLSSANLGTLGMHPTLLPEGRGRASIPWAILKQLPRTGVSLFRLDDGVDTGPVLAQQVIPLDVAETAERLYGKVTDAHITLLREVWPRLDDGSIQACVQDDAKSTVWPGRSPEDGEIDPRSMSVEYVDRLVRATGKPYPGAFVRRSDGSVLRIWSGAPDGGEAAGEVLELTDGRYAIHAYDVEWP